MAVDIERVLYKFQGDTSNLAKATSKASELLGKYASATKNAASSFKSMASSTSLLTKSLGILTGVKLGDWLANATKQSISYIENLNLFTVAMGESVQVGKEFVGTMQELYGMDPSNIMRHAGNFYQLSDAIDMPAKSAAQLSLTMTKAANDISSLFNIDIETVTENLMSGMQGMSRAVRKYGMDIRITTLQQTALTLGIKANVAKMSEANRQGLRFITMMRQAANASGDFARTIETPANQLKIFKEQMTQLGRAIGNFFIRPLTTAISYVNGFVMALRTALTFIGALVGAVDQSASVDVSGLQKESDAIGDIGDSADKSAKKLKDLTAPFDELNVLQEQSAAGGKDDSGLGAELLDPKIAAEMAKMESTFEKVKMKANQVRDAILSFFGFKYDMTGAIYFDPSQLEENLINKFPQWTATIQATFDNWSTIFSGFRAVLRSLGGVLALVATKVLDFIGAFANDQSVADFISGLATNLAKLSLWIDDNADTLANFVLTIGGLVLAFKAFGTIASVLSALGTVLAPIIALGSAILGLVAPFATFLGIAGRVIGAIMLLREYSESFREAFDRAMTATGEAISTLWSATLKPTFSGIMQVIQSVIDIVSKFWNEILWPVIQKIATGLANLWTNTILPIITKVIEIIAGVIDIVTGLWNNVLAPIVNWLIHTLAPSVVNMISTIWDTVEWFFTAVGNFISGLLTALKGIIDFIAGVFTGDWGRAWNGILNLFIGIINAVISCFELGINGMISLLNLFISWVFNGIIGLINMLLGELSGIAKILGFDLDLRITAKPPEIPKLAIPRIPELATGGVVRSPTVLMAGEGQYDEAIIPLGNSPQMKELVSEIVKAIKNDPNPNDNRPVEVQVFIGDKEWDAFTYRSSERGKKLVGAQPIVTGG